MSRTCSEGRAGSAAQWCLAAGIALLALALPGTVAAQTLSLDLGTDAGLTGRVIQLFLLVTVLSMAPGIAMMVTCFPFMVTVLAILRQGLGLQQSPPNMLMVALALFLTWFVMEPVFTEAWDTALGPLAEGRISAEDAWDKGVAPFRVFMEGRVDAVALTELAAAAPGRSAALVPGEPAPLSILVPAFMLSEIERGFEIGFMLFLPFLVIDLVVASVLMSMGMMMVPPVVVSLPLKLAFFVIADGWALVAGALVRGYGA
ncbi:flagellar type III secretion system pore protein FliP [Limibaculum sp. M0105]|uniref:Flagellar biosynthetic protein FliP n=1 Tax=Thermohalobaculum xanthum TaxID=2753746 RepID=A0A8J7M4N8_9RHOB|nr:flagellar type III secretion system pore protein FliP [Thermohalobaculum xanthum]MBK0398138.1 flagellar type III secretion system pore protein FliP [Thermohalobaculum xanthum]